MSAPRASFVLCVLLLMLCVGAAGGIGNATVERYHIASVDWPRIRVPCTVALWIAFAILAKIGFHLSGRLASIFPDSSLLILLGLFVGGVLYALNSAGLITGMRRIHLEPTLFFFYLLPPIVLDAGYFMPNRAFFGNLYTILVFAVIGTVWNVATIGTSLWAVGRWLGGFSVPTSLLDLMLFASIVSAVDPVAVLVVFEEVHVNQLLYISVFSESLLNDAVTVVLYKMCDAFTQIGEDNLLPVDVFSAFVSFFVVSLGGILMGLIWAVLTSLVTKHTSHITVVQPLICLLFPYLAYLFSELFHVSGILAIVMCGMTMKEYVKANISHKSATTVKYFLKTLTSSCETIIFMFLGLSTVSASHHYDWRFIGATILFCLLYRFIGVLALSAAVNRLRTARLTAQDQLIMAYGGLRGAVSFGLVASLRDSYAAKEMFLTTTIVVILFTVFVLGMTIKPLVELLHVKRRTTHKLNLSEQIFSDLTDHTMAGVEEISGVHGQYFFNDLFQRYDTQYLRPLLTQDSALNHSRSSNLVNTLNWLRRQEVVDYLDKHGSLPPAPCPHKLTGDAEEEGPDLVPFTQTPPLERSRPAGGLVSFTLDVDKPTTKTDSKAMENFYQNMETSKMARRGSLRYSRQLLDADMKGWMSARKARAMSLRIDQLDDTEPKTMSARVARKLQLKRYKSVDTDDLLLDGGTGNAMPLQYSRSLKGRLLKNEKNNPVLNETTYGDLSRDSKDMIRIVGAPERMKDSNMMVLPIYFIRRDHDQPQQTASPEGAEAVTTPGSTERSLSVVAEVADDNCQLGDGRVKRNRDTDDLHQREAERAPLNVGESGDERRRVEDARRLEVTPGGVDDATEMPLLDVRDTTETAARDASVGRTMETPKVIDD